MVKRRRWRMSAALAAVVAMTIAGCSDSDKEPTTVATASEAASDGITYVGKVDASSANIGLVTKGDRLAGLVCQDANASLRLDAVTVANGTAELKQDGTVVGTVSVADDIAVGTVEFAGSKHRFQAEPARVGWGVPAGGREPRRGMGRMGRPQRRQLHRNEQGQAQQRPPMD